MNETLFSVLITGLVTMFATASFVYLFVVKNYKIQVNEIKKTNETLIDDLALERKQRELINVEYVSAKSELHYAYTKLNDQKDELEQLNEKLSKDFENIANRVVNHSSKVLQEKHEEKLMAILTPFKERIEKFEQRVDATHRENTKDNQALKEQLSHLRELNRNIGEEAKNLTSALKGDKKLQGNWGENSLERIIQAAGLEKEKHYRKEVNLKDDSNTNFRADYIIYLPDSKNLIIDSKVSLVAYSRYFGTEDEDEAKKAMKTHVQNVRTHISTLSSKNYSELHGVNSPDYVIMYMPIDSALGMAMTEDTELFDYALKKNIVLVSNNSLLATLKTVAFIWNQDLQKKNALEIARQGGALYDKFVGFIDTLVQVGKKIEEAQFGYSKAMSQLKEGKGNLVGRSQKLKELGIKSTKNMPDQITRWEED
ncbi:MAG: DNA recombination protein RmuC [Bacteroidetes bacterium]|nr:MAG: DNA recombination protein RmuC [Bacteroidota bacterium]